MKENVYNILKERYFLSTETTWEEVAERVSTIYPKIKNDIIEMNYIPSSPTLMNCNTNGERKGTLSSCFPMNIEDSIEGIFEAVTEAAITTRMGGGIGYNFSSLRGSTEGVKGIGGRCSSGPLPFIDIFNSVLDGVQQGGARRGAGMAMMSIYHPNILDFLNAKKDLSKYNRFNFSIRIPTKFYETLEKFPDSYHMVTTRKTKEEYPLVDKEGNIVTTKQLWDMIIDNAWTMAEPGIFNSDIAFERCANTNLNKNVLSNPCSEFTNIPYTSCCLGSINLSNLVKDKIFDWKKLEDIVIKAVNHLNAVIDNNEYPIEKIKDITLKTRPIGLGVMGLAHALYKMDVPYNSDEATHFTEQIMKFITLKGMEHSVELAKKDGAYPSFDFELFKNANARFFNNDKNKSLLNRIKQYGIRNSSITSIAPTGSISYMADCSGGIEPVFALSYARKIEKDGKQYETVYLSDPVFEEYLYNTFDGETRIKILKNVSENKGSCQKCDLIPEDKRKVFVVAGDLTAKEHLDILEVTANNISLSVSKTINMPSDCTKEEISEVFLEAYKRGIIGVTCYRGGCRDGILIYDTDNKVDRSTDIIYNSAPKRPKELPAEIHRVTYQGEKWIVFVGLLKGKPYELFAGKVEEVSIPKMINNGILIKQGSKHYSFKHEDEIIIDNILKTFANLNHDAFARQVSQSLRHGVQPLHVVDSLDKAQGDITHFAKVLGRTLKKYIENGKTGGKCASCGEPLIYVEGCIKCSNPECFFTKCG